VYVCTYKNNCVESAAHPSLLEQVFSVSERTVAPFRIGLVRAFDEDAGETSGLTFSILDGNSDGLFELRTPNETLSNDLALQEVLFFFGGGGFTSV
jgi:hypothetical protein